jgi:hypothetical protein
MNLVTLADENLKIFGEYPFISTKEVSGIMITQPFSPS